MPRLRGLTAPCSYSRLLFSNQLPTSNFIDTPDKVLTGFIFCLLFVEDWNLNQLGRNCHVLGHQWKQQTDWDIDLQAPLDLAGVGSQWPYCPQNFAQCWKHVLHKCTQFTLKTKMFAILKSNETVAIPKLQWNPEPLREVKIGLSCWRFWEI